MKRQKFYAIGLMSGTSLDGLDIAWCRFVKQKKGWSFQIKEAKTVTYSVEWKARLQAAHNLSGESLMQLHSKYGHWTGTKCREFIKQFKITKLDLIASHGHTVFHQPQNRFTFQLGDGNGIFSETKVPVIFDFRSLDVQLGGQGAPLVPVGDRLLFSDYDVCLNLGGIANLSMERNKQRIAFDICFANMGLNFLASQAGLDFDRDGILARKGRVDQSLLEQLHKFYMPFRAKRPSLAREHFESGLKGLLENDRLSLEDRANTLCYSIAHEIERCLHGKKKVNMLVTGGGTKNKFLMETISKQLDGRANLIIPVNRIIDYKEAMIFAFLGVLKWKGKNNVLNSVTGARRDSSSGIIAGKCG